LEGDFLDDQTVEKILRQAAYGIGEGAPVPVGGLFRVEEEEPGEHCRVWCFGTFSLFLFEIIISANCRKYNFTYFLE
jgi:hypothetical protein